MKTHKSENIGLNGDKPETNTRCKTKGKNGYSEICDVINADGMRRYVLMVFSYLSIVGCSYDVEEADLKPEDPGTVMDCQTVSFIDDIKPIIDTNCAISGCHNGSQFPDLSTFSGVSQHADRVKVRTGERSMPIGRTLTSDEIEKIGCWVDSGALNN